jgi:cobalt-zinc-cadmium efflux system outer membrane protein
MFVGLLSVLAFAQALSFQDAVARVDQAPGLIAEAQVAAAREQHARRVSRMVYNPTLLVQPGARSMAAGGSGAELYVTLTQRLSLGGAGKARRAALERESEHDRERAALLRFELRRAAAETWLACWSAHAIESLAAAELELAETMATGLAPQVQAGEATRADEAGARSWAAEARLAVLSAEADGFREALALASLLGLDARAPQAVSSELPALALADRDQVKAADTTPVRAARGAHAVEAARLTELVAAKKPTLALGVNGWREGNGDVAALLNVEVELPVFERGERERASQAALTADAAGRAELAALHGEVALLLARHEIEHSQAVLAVSEQELVLSAERFADTQRARLEAREGTMAEWLVARRAVLRARIDLVRARAEHTLARFVWAELTGATR